MDEPHKITQRDVPRERERFEFTGQGTQRCGRGGQRQPSEEAMSASGASARPEMDGGGEASICQGPVAGWGLGHSGSQRGSVAGAERERQGGAVCRALELKMHHLLSDPLPLDGPMAPATSLT